jgi:hypothetical protein
MNLLQKFCEFPPGFFDTLPQKMIWLKNLTLDLDFFNSKEFHHPENELKEKKIIFFCQR